MTSHSEDGMRIFFGARVYIPLRCWATSSYLIPCLHTLSYLIPPHHTSGWSENRGPGVSGECPGMGGVSVFGQLLVSSSGKLRREETEKCVGRNYWGHVSSAENNKSNKEIKGKQAQFKFKSWSRKIPSQSKKE